MWNYFTTPLSLFSRLSFIPRLVTRIVFYTAALLFVVPAFFAYKIATPQRLLSPQTTPSVFGLPFQNLEYTVPGGISLKGWYIPAKNQLGIFILLHGLGDSKEAYLPRAEMIVKDGYSVVIYDHRSHGESGGKYTTLGIKESKDLLQVIFKLREQYPKPIPIYLWGFSMGAAMILASLPNTPPINGAVVDSAFPSLEQAFNQHARSAMGIPTFPFANITLFFFRWITGIKNEEVSPINAVSHSTGIPLFFVARENDHRIPLTHVQQLFDAYRDQRKKLWVIPGADHLHLGDKQNEYWQLVITFFNKLNSPSN